MRKLHAFALKALSAVICITALISLLAPLSVFAENNDTVTVAYIDYNNFIEKSEDGTYSGYGADYLNKISEYTGWNYKYVEMDWPSAYSAVKEGTVDFYCVARQTEERQDDFDFSLYPVCNEEMNLYTTKETKLFYEDFRALDGMKIGMLQSSGEIDYFREYAKENDFSFTLVEYPLNEDAVNALKDGEIDAIALVNYSVDSDLKLIGNFGVSPAYMMSREGSSYMRDFSKAQERLFFDSPNFTSELEKKYYSQTFDHDGLLLTREETEFIANCKPLTVAVSTDMAPTEYYDSATNSYKGMTIDVYNRIGELTGLKFNFVKRENEEILTKQMQDGEVQLVGAMAQSNVVVNALKIRQSSSFAENSFSVVTKKDAVIDSSSVVAVPVGYPQFYAAAVNAGYSNIYFYDDFEECIKAVKNGKADLTYIITMTSSYLLNHAEYAGLRTIVDERTSYGICFGAADSQDGRVLLSIINKALYNISDREIDDIIVYNTANATPKTSFLDFISDNALFLFILAFAAFVLIMTSVITFQKSHQKQLIAQKEQSHYSFLQHLYNSIPCGVFQYAYESPHKILNYNAACVKIYGYENGEKFVGSTPDTVVKKETAEKFAEKFELCEKTDGPIIYTWPITRLDGSVGYAECVMDVVETEQGKVFQEVFVDVTERALNEQRNVKKYMRELARHGKANSRQLYFTCFDITEQILTQTDIDVEGVHVGMTVSEFVEALLPELSELQTEEQLDDFRTRFTSERMNKEYENDLFEQSFDLCRRKDGQFQWLHSDLSLRYNPTTNHLMCFDYVSDITDKRVTEDVMRSIALSGCEAFMCIDAKTGRCLEYTVETGENLMRSETIYAKNDIIGKIADKMTEADRAQLFEQTEPFNVYEHLKKDGRHNVYATYTNNNGERTDKALTFFFIDTGHLIVAMTVTDVTEARADEVRHAQLLADALASAEKADAAKSQFLSRVSHEMRTPLNAIIGFIELSKNADKEKMDSYLMSSDIASKQLLNVINDVLDMSSIESGKLKIANAPFNFKHLLSAITNIYGLQCKQKNIAFETKIATPVDEWLVGDELRINQILMNLLGNSVKFTHTGYIRLKISETAVNDGRSFIRFEVSDTGCGMSDEMKERLFKPFEQENALTAKKYGGSGLGLSIVKNLVTMMDGSVRVDSTLGKGTTFFVDIPLGKSEIDDTIHLPDGVENLRILAVDDEITEREYMSLVLERMGVRFTCVESGNEALSELEKSERDDDLYNVCIVDWRMPGMNGHDTTSRIREKYGKDMVVIVVSAYDFQQAGDNAKEAGANLFLSKPIFQSSLFDLFMTLTDGKIAKPEQEPQAWDFDGMRILLVEDNTLNQIVAKGYLAKFNVVCDVAQNGQEAVDKFAASTPGYYKAILMDIQMPLMDGYEATKTIRASSHPEASTIPIIAQTADAFNEDISKALSCGMNYHVSKPIKPDVLAKALYKATSNNK